jgi:hypothetical protein
MREPDGTALYGAYIQIATLAASCTPRGFLIHPDGQPHDAESIALRVGGDVKIISRCLEVLQRSDINWLSSHPFTPAEIPADSSRLQQTPADSSRFQQIPADPLEFQQDARARPFPSLPFLSSKGEYEGESGRNGLFPKCWEEDSQFASFATDYMATGGSFISEDFADAWGICWKLLDFEQKSQRIAALAKRSAEFRADPRFTPKPLKFLQSEWKRDPKPAPKGKLIVDLRSKPPGHIDNTDIERHQAERRKKIEAEKNL